MSFHDWRRFHWQNPDAHGGRSPEARFNDLLREAYVGGIRDAVRAIDAGLMQLRSLPDSKAKQSARRSLAAHGLKICQENGLIGADVPSSFLEFCPVPAMRGEEGA